MESHSAKLYEAVGRGDGDALGVSSIRRSLQVVRQHLGMDVAYLSRLDGDTWTLRDFDAAWNDVGMKSGRTMRRAETYCGNVVDGRLPRLIPDTAAVPLALRLPATRSLTIGAHVASPVRVDEGGVWGMLCCCSFKPDPSLNERDLSLLDAVADMVAFEVTREFAEGRQTRESRERIAAVLGEADGMVALLQPVWDLGRGAPWGAEARCRIAADPHRGPDAWFAEAQAVSLREEFELAALRTAVAALGHLDPAYVLSLNVSPSTVLARGFRDVLDGLPPHRLLIELTEHLPVDDYAELRAALAPLRGAGMRVAVDDAGGGYASMTRILQLQPDIIKADMALTRDIDGDRAKQALVAALIGFAKATRATLLAEGIETAGELAELKRLGISLGHGYLLGRPSRPADLDTAFACGAAAFRPALSRGREAAEAQVVTDFAHLLAARRRFASAVDPRLGRWVV